MTARHRTGVVALLALVLSAGATAAHGVQGAVPTGAPAAATVRLEIGGDAPAACSGALVDTWWVLTSASCFRSPSGAAVTRGTPPAPTRAVVGRPDLESSAGAVVDVDLVVPHPDRDVVLARLTAPAGVAPVAVSAAPPAVGEQLTVTGYGRTTTEVVPRSVHAATFTVAAVTGTSVGIEAQDAGATICKGDAGGPALRPTAGGVELVAIHSTAYQGGCLGASATRQAATETLVTDLRGWIGGIVPDVPLRDLEAGDWSGDGHADVLGVDVRGTLWYYPHDGGGLSARVRLAEGWGAFTHVMAVDFSGDGHADVLAVDPAGRLWYYPHNRGALSPPVLLGSGWETFGHVTAADWNNDGRADVLGVDAQGRLWLYVNTRLTLPTKVQIGSGWGSFRRVLAGDYSGDGSADVLGITSEGRLLYYPHNGGSLSAPVEVGHGWAGFTDVMVADWTRDGRVDLLAVDPDSRLWVYQNRNGVLAGRTQIGGAPQMR